MKKYKIQDLTKCLQLLTPIDNIVINDFREKVIEEIKIREVKFVKASDDYLKTLTRNDIYIRPLKESDEYYYKGMYGMFEKKTDILLRRHTDTGFLSLPNE